MVTAHITQIPHTPVRQLVAAAGDGNSSQLAKAIELLALHTGRDSTPREREEVSLAVREALQTAERKQLAGRRRRKVEKLLLPLLQIAARSGGARTPDVLLGGFGKCGSSSLHRLLTELDIGLPVCKEVRYFDGFPSARPEIYCSYFPDAPGKPLMDTSPGYSQAMDHGLARARDVLRPDVRLLFITRDPVRRAASAFFSPDRASRRNARAARAGVQPISFAESIRAEMAALRTAVPRYLSGAIGYDELRLGLPSVDLFGAFFRLHMDRFKRFFPAAPILHLSVEDDLTADGLPRALRKLAHFLDVAIVRPAEGVPHRNKSAQDALDPAIFEELQAFCQEFADQIYVGDGAQATTDLK